MLTGFLFLQLALCCCFQIGVSNTFALLRYSYTFEEHEFTVKTCVRFDSLSLCGFTGPFGRGGMS